MHRACTLNGKVTQRRFKRSRLEGSPSCSNKNILKNGLFQGILRQKQVLISEMFYKNIKVLCIRNFVGYVVNVQYKLITQAKL